MICLRIERASWATDNSTRPFIARGWWGSHPPRVEKQEQVRMALFAVTARSWDEALALAKACAQAMHNQPDPQPIPDCVEIIVSRDGQTTEPGVRCEFGGCRCGRRCR
jgi:hypothetical protein